MMLRKAASNMRGQETAETRLTSTKYSQEKAKQTKQGNEHLVYYFSEIEEKAGNPLRMP